MNYIIIIEYNQVKHPREDVYDVLWNYESREDAKEEIAARVEEHGDEEGIIYTIARLD